MPCPMRTRACEPTQLRRWCALPQKRTIFLQKKECCAGSLEGTFIRALTKLTHAKSVLEVGMFTGTTTMAIADALPQDGKVRPPACVTSAAKLLLDYAGI